MISNAAVFWPSIRCGLMELTTATGAPESAASRTSRRASSKLPSTVTTFAPWTMLCASLPSAILPAGRST